MIAYIIIATISCICTYLLRRCAIIDWERRDWFRGRDLEILLQNNTELESMVENGRCLPYYLGVCKFKLPRILTILMYILSIVPFAGIAVIITFIVMCCCPSVKFNETKLSKWLFS